MKRELTTALVLACAASLAYGAISPSIIHIESGVSSYTTTYTVPTGKVFVWSAFRCYANYDIEIKAPDNTVDPIPYTSTAQLQTFQLPLLIPEGYMLRVKTGAAGSKATLYGSVVDPTDLYVGIPNQFNNVASAGTSFSGLLALASPRPARVQIEESSDLKAWGSSPATVARTEDAGLWQFTTDTAATSNSFFRAKVSRKK